MAGYLQVPQCSVSATMDDVINTGFYIYDNTTSRRFLAMPEIGVPFGNNQYLNQHCFKVNYYQSGSLYWVVVGTLSNENTTLVPRCYMADGNGKKLIIYGNYTNSGGPGKLHTYSYAFSTDFQLPPGASVFSSLKECEDAMMDGEWEYKPEDTDPYAGIDGEGNIPGGGTITIPSFPSLSATSTGIIGLFAPSLSQMQLLANYMWTDFGGTGTDVTEVLKEIVEALKRSISNPLDYVIGLNIIPSQGLSIGALSEIKFGFTSSGVSMPRLSNQYFSVDCGSISFPPLCGDTFLDYAPYSKFSIYLPYIGVKDVDANDFVGHTIGVFYHGDTVTGGVTAYITKDGSVMYQYSGCCALNIPLSADNWGNTISGAVQIATSLVAAGASGGAAGVAMAAAKGAASVAANPSLLSPQVSHSGAVSGGAGCMAVQYPFVIREAVRFHSTSGFNKFSGYPSYYNRSLGDVSGFTTVLDVHLENIPATSVEIAEIENLLKSGVIL